MIKMMGALSDRDMHAWWGEYDAMIEDYRSKWDGMICTEDELLADLLDDIRQKVVKVRFGWTQKREQLQKIRDILEHDDYKNVTGLHKALNDYLSTQDQQATDEDEHLKLEEADVANETTRLNTHPCPCVWGEWSDWGECSVTCGIDMGIKYRQREVAKEATNGGTACDGLPTDNTSCGDIHCPIDCVWGHWGEFGECDTLCGDGLRERHRVREIVAEYNGTECEGEPTSNKVCNVLDETRREVAEQKARIAELEQELAAETESDETDASECEIIDNQYWSYGDLKTVRDVSNFKDCCRLCKEDPECTNFSFGKEGQGFANQCFKKRGGSAQGRGDFMSSPKDITACEC